MKWILAIAVMCFSSFFIIACSGQTDSEERLYWNVQDGHFYTTDMERALKKTEFTLILPGYLPEKIKTVPPYFMGPAGWALAKDEMWLLVVYSVTSEDGIKSKIEIEGSAEESDFAAYLDRLGYPYNSYDYIDISGKQVIIRKAGTGATFETFLYFNRDGRSFRISVSGFSEEEAIKVVASMLE
jgi:hypothetical protein